MYTLPFTNPMLKTAPQNMSAFVPFCHEGPHLELDITATRAESTWRKQCWSRHGGVGRTRGGPYFDTDRSPGEPGRMQGTPGGRGALGLPTPPPHGTGVILCRKAYGTHQNADPTAAKSGTLGYQSHFRLGMRCFCGSNAGKPPGYLTQGCWVFPLYCQHNRK